MLKLCLYYNSVWKAAMLGIAANIASVQHTIAQANELPTAHYVDERIYEEKKHVLLFPQSAGVTIAADAPKKNEVIRLTFLGTTG